MSGAVSFSADPKSDPVATRLRVEMALHGVRPSMVAREVGIPKATLSRIINGKQRPSDAMLSRIEGAIRGGGR